MIIFLVLLAIKFIKGTFEYERVTRLRLVVVPFYSILMMVALLHHHYSRQTLALATALLAIGLAVGVFQAKRVQLRDTGEVDQYQRPIVEVKRNWPYLVGWIVIFALQLALEIYFGMELTGHEFSQALLKEILRDLSVVAFFGAPSAWFVWVLNVATSWAYAICLLIFYPQCRAAVRRRKQ
ncbi:hydrophobic protein [uncultured Limosilactobacillus sp.]|uniref:hydrophobic protein n=1 Tax=uncultured Limosilactobacillus sp. TaxID=2837629 RepID=UPI0025F3D148|nr:hydrophobic protein [uncultured Limosilactobacillus sp.]